MIYPTVTIGSAEYATYSSQADVTTYLAASIASSWADATDANQKKAIVSATRWIDSANWQGTTAESGQALKFPMSGLTRRDGTEVADDSIPPEVAAATAELASVLIDDATARATQTNELVARSLQAGSASISFFRPQSLSTGAAKFPQSVMDLLGFWLEGATSFLPVQSFDTDEESAIEDFDLDHGV